MNIFKKRKIGTIIALLLLVVFPGAGIAQTTGAGATVKSFSGPTTGSYVDCTCSQPSARLVTIGGAEYLVTSQTQITGDAGSPGATAIGQYIPDGRKCYVNNLSAQRCELYGKPLGTITKVGISQGAGQPSTGAGASGLGGGSSLNNILGTGALLLGVGALAAGALGGGESGAGSSGVGSSGSGFEPQDVSVPTTMGTQAEDYLNDNGVEVAPNVSVDDLSIDVIEDTIDLEGSTGAPIVVVGGNEELSNTYNSGESIVNIQKNDAINKAIIENASTVVRNTKGLSNVFIVQPSASIPAGQYYDEAKGTGVAHWRILFTR